MHRLSLEYMDCPWGKDLEFQLFQQLSGLRFKHLISVTKQEEQELRKLGRAVNGWYYWSTTNSVPQFLSWGAWERIFNDWHLKTVLFTKPLPPENI
tara:strand:+ start:1171 stop:1458 length:288 start_codon:yes stop_codon:yes gene_type:complete